MKLLVILLSVLLFALIASSQRRLGRHQRFQEISVPARKSTRVIEDNWITPKINHFNDQNTSTFNLRYFENGEHYVEGGPFFIFVGGEGAIHPGWVTGGHLYDMAKEMNGYLFTLEHRYYGQSKPVLNTETINLSYLDVDQAIEDLAYFIRTMKQTIPGATNSKVILASGSYPGSLVVWFRQRYPDLADGVWSSSAPVLADKDFAEYMEIVAWAMGHIGGQTCYDRLEEAFAQMETYLANGETQRLQTLFDICPGFDFNKQLDVWNLFELLSSELSWVVQFAVSGDIEAACASITDPTIPVAAEAFAKWVVERTGSCYDASYQSWVDVLLETDFKPNEEFAWRVWVYQTCNEFGWFQTSASDNQPFGSTFPADLTVQWCADAFDNIFNYEKIEQNIYNTNLNHGGLTPDVTNVFFTHGELDPYRGAGIQSDLNPSSPAVVLEGYAHCDDFNSISDADSAQMRETKERIAASVREWVGFNK